MDQPQFRGMDNVSSEEFHATFYRYGPDAIRDLMNNHIRKEDDESATEMCVTLLFRPFRGWARVRLVFHIRSIVLFWLKLTEHLMAPGGRAEQRDKLEYKASMT